MKTNVGKVRVAVKAALECAEEKGYTSIAFPGMGTGVGGVPVSDAAHVMIEVIKEFIDHGTNVKRIILVGFSKDLTGAFINSVREFLESQ